MWFYTVEVNYKVYKIYYLILLVYINNFSSFALKFAFKTQTTMKDYQKAQQTSKKLVVKESKSSPKIIFLFKSIRIDNRKSIIARAGYTEQLTDLFTEAYNLKKNTLDRLVPPV